MKCTLLLCISQTSIWLFLNVLDRKWQNGQEYHWSRPIDFSHNWRSDTFTGNSRINNFLHCPYHSSLSGDYWEHSGNCCHEKIWENEHQYLFICSSCIWQHFPSYWLVLKACFEIHSPQRWHLLQKWLVKFSGLFGSFVGFFWSLLDF